MKKIIAAFDGLKYSQSTTDYAIDIAKHSNAHLIGVFIEDPNYTSFKIADLIQTEDKPYYTREQLIEKDKKTRQEAVNAFEKSCRLNSIEHSIHHDHHAPISDLLHESIYCDLLVINAKENFSHFPENILSSFIRELLSEVQCPIMLVPDHFSTINKIDILYDGEPASVHAIKMFSYLLPAFKHLETEVISGVLERSSSHVPDNRLMKEYMKRHFPTAKYTVLKGWAEQEIPNFLKSENKNALVVLGAYQRGKVSRWFKESMADQLLKEIKLPLFIAHR